MNNLDVKKYLDKLEATKKKLVSDLINQIAELVPDSILYMSYGMPCFKYKGKYLIGVGAFQNHVSLFPGGEVVEVFKQDLINFKTSKGTIQIPIDSDFPNSLLSKIVKFRTKQIDN